jgi:hypothetical protein
MTSNNINLGQEFGSVGEPSSSSYTEQTDSKTDWEKAHKDPAGWVNEQVSAVPICNEKVPAPTPIDLKGQNVLDAIVKDTFAKDQSCRVVFTGNAGNTSNGDITYAKAMAYAMAEDMCNKSEAHESFLKGPRTTDDALHFDHFNGKSLGKVPKNNVAATYALTYALGYRESSGNFIQPRDPWAVPLNTGSEEETGFTQTSANSLNPEKSKVAKNIFKNYVSTLSGMSSQEEMAKFCLNDKLEGNQQTRLVENDSKKFGKKVAFDHKGQGLYNLFQSDSSVCKKISQKVQGYFVANNRPDDPVVQCYKELHKNCPGFSIKYSAAITRTNRRHQGPLRSGQSKPPPQPSCQMLFDSIVQNEQAICSALASKPVSLEVEGSDQDKKDDLMTLGVPESPKPGEILKPSTDPAPKFPTIDIKSEKGTGELLKTDSKSEPPQQYQLRETKTETGSPVVVVEKQTEGPPVPPQPVSSDEQTLFENYKKLGGDPIAFEQAMCFLKSKGNTSFKSYGEGYRNGIKIENQRYVTIQDLTKPSTQKRLFLLDRQTGKVEVIHTGHSSGKDSNTNGKVWAKNFSNTVDSNNTPSGFFITGNTYISKKKWRIGMRLHGLQQGINDNSFTRGIVVHGGDYVQAGVATESDSSPKLMGGAAGLSHGCTVVNFKQRDNLFAKLASGKEGDYPYRGGSLFYNFSPSEKSKGPSYCGDRLVPEVK